MNPWDAKLVSATFENYLKEKGMPVPECVPAGNSRGACVVCVDERLNGLDFGRKTIRNAGARTPKFVDGTGADGELAFDLGLIFGATAAGDNAVLMVTGHTDCKANTQLFEALTGTGTRQPTQSELARIPDDLQTNLVKALGNHADKEALVEAMTKIIVLQNMQNMLEYKTPAGAALKDMLAAGNIFPIVAAVDSKTHAVEIYDWEEKQYRPLAEIVKDAERADIYTPGTTPKSFMVSGGTTATVTEFYGRDLLETIRASVERIGNMSAPGVGHG